MWYQAVRDMCSNSPLICATASIVHSVGLHCYFVALMITLLWIGFAFLHFFYDCFKLFVTCNDDHQICSVIDCYVRYSHAFVCRLSRDHVWQLRFRRCDILSMCPIILISVSMGSSVCRVHACMCGFITVFVCVHHVRNITARWFLCPHVLRLVNVG